MIRKTCHLLSLLILLLIGCSPKTAEQSAPQLPNILFLFADDFTYEAIHALGNDVIETPNLDRLVADGTTFTHAYNMGGWHGAVCVASRSMIISGQSLWRARAIEKKWLDKDPQATQNTWGELMNDQGYNTYMSGKWHIAVPVDSVFQTVAGFRKGGMPPDRVTTNWQTMRAAKAKYERGEAIDELLPVGYNRPKHENDTTWRASDPKHGGFWEGGQHWSEALKDHALDFLADAAQNENPFFMYLAFNAPHDPRQAPQSFLDKYPLDNIPLPENWLPEYPYKDSIGNAPYARDEALAPFPRTPLAIKTHLKEYYAIISHLDEQIGKILDALEASGMTENTYIFFTGDHGLSVGHHGLLGKQSLFDHSVRVPLMVKGPTIPVGKKVTEPVYLQDLMATSLELAGIPKPDYVDFHSFLDLALGKATKSAYSEGVYGAYMNSQRMIRTNKYKLLVYPKIDKLLLFDVQADPLEMNDLAAQPTYQSTVQEMLKRLIELQKKMNDELDISYLLVEDS